MGQILQDFGFLTLWIKVFQMKIWNNGRSKMAVLGNTDEDKIHMTSSRQSSAMNPSRFIFKPRYSWNDKGESSSQVNLYNSSEKEVPVTCHVKRNRGISWQSDGVPKYLANSRRFPKVYNLPQNSKKAGKGSLFLKWTFKESLVHLMI